MDRQVLELLADGALGTPQIAQRLGRDVSEVQATLIAMSEKGFLNPPVTTQWGDDMSTVMTYYRLSGRGHEELIRQRAAEQ